MSLGYIKDATYQFQISTFMESGLTPGFSRVSSKESKRMLVVPEISLDILDIHNMQVYYMHR